MAPLQFLSLHLKIGFCLPESLIPLFQYWLLRSSHMGPEHFGHITVVIVSSSFCHHNHSLLVVRREPISGSSNTPILYETTFVFVSSGIGPLHLHRNNMKILRSRVALRRDL